MDLDAPDADLDLGDVDLPPFDDGDPPGGGPPRRRPVGPVLPWLALLLGVIAAKQAAMIALPSLPKPFGAWGVVLLLFGTLVGGVVLAIVFARAWAADVRPGARG